MASTESELSPAEKNIDEQKQGRGRPSMNKKTTTGIGTMSLSKEQVVFLGAMVAEAARMTSVRDGAPDPSHVKNTIVMVERMYEEFVGND